MDVSSKRYQEYLKQSKEWEKKKAEIEGADDQVDTVKYYQAQLKYINDILPIAIKQEHEARLGISKKSTNV